MLSPIVKPAQRTRSGHVLSACAPRCPRAPPNRHERCATKPAEDYIGSDIVDVVLKPVRWLGTTRDDIRGLRPAVRYEFGQQLMRVQVGLMPNNYKPMRTVGHGAYEIRVQDADG